VKLLALKLILIVIFFLAFATYYSKGRTLSDDLTSAAKATRDAYVSWREQRKTAEFEKIQNQLNRRLTEVMPTYPNMAPCIQTPVGLDCPTQGIECIQLPGGLTSCRQK
jgi:hypothetical protein